MTKRERYELKIVDEIELWEQRKSEAIAAYDKKIADLTSRLNAEHWLQSDSSHGATLLRPNNSLTHGA